METLITTRLILLLSLTTFGLLARAETKPAEPTEIAVDVEDGATPWSNPDGTGFANDVVKAAFDAVHVKAHLQIKPYARCKMEALRGETPACFSMSWDDELRDKIVFSDKPLFTCDADYYFNLKKPLSYNKEENIPAGTRVGIVNEYEYPKSIQALKAKGVIFIKGPSEEVNIKKLALGRLDLILINHNDVKPAALMIERAGAKKEIGFAFNSGVLLSYIGFSNQNPQGKWAREKFNQGYQIILKNGTIHRLEVQWLKKITP